MTKIVDCHAHLDDPLCAGFLESLRSIKNEPKQEEEVIVFSNSVDFESSEANLTLAAKLPESIVAFAGIHPQSAEPYSKLSIEKIRTRLDALFERASGIGEIGLDPKYGNTEFQLTLLEMQLELSETHPELPVTLHSRDSLQPILERLSILNSPRRILFHWFSGSASELGRVEDQGGYVSFGPTLLFSKRLGQLARQASDCSILSETDSPLLLKSLSNEPVSPLVISRVVSKIAEIKNWTFEKAAEIICENAGNYLGSAKLIKPK